MAQLLADRAPVRETGRVSDLRGGTPTPAGTAVLEDPTGRRRRRLRLLSRAIALALTLWLVALVLGAAGLSPVPGVPFARIFRAPAAPAPKKLPTPVQPTASDLKPARPASHAAAARASIPAASRPATGSQPAPSGAPRATHRPAKSHRVTPATPPVAGHTPPGSVSHGPAAPKPAPATR